MKKSLIVLTLLSCNAFAQLEFPQDTIAYNGRFNNRQTVALDSKGRIHIVYSGSLGTNSASREIYYAVVDADSVSRFQITNNAVDDNYPTISIDANDHIHICFVSRDAGNVFQVQYTNNRSGSFHPPVSITTGGVNKATPWGAIGQDSIVHVVYYHNTAGQDSVYYRSYDLRDSTLSLIIRLGHGETTGDLDASIAVDGGGFIHIAFRSGAVASGGPLRYFTNRGGTLTEIPTGVATNVDYPKILVDRNDVVHILYRQTSGERLHLINNAGGSFGVPIVVTPSNQRPAFYNNFAVDDFGRLYIVYQSSVSTSGRGFFLVHGKGGVFSDTIRIYDLTPEYVTRNSSAVTARGNGDIALFYAPGGTRNSVVICDIFMKRGYLFGPPAPSISIDNDTLTLTAAGSWCDSLYVKNVGTASLAVDSILLFSSDSVLYSLTVEPAAFLVSPGDSQLVRAFLTARTAPAAFDFEDSLFVYSNDPQDSVKIIVVRGDYIVRTAGEGRTPATTILYQNYPNPFNPATRIRFNVPEITYTVLTVYNVLGQVVAVLVNDLKPPGTYTVNFEAAHLPAGLYFYRLAAGKFSETKKLILLR